MDLWDDADMDTNLYKLGVKNKLFAKLSTIIAQLTHMTCLAYVLMLGYREAEAARQGEVSCTY